MTIYRATSRRELLAIARRYGVAKDLGIKLDAVSRVFPLRANPYVLEHLIDWDNIPDDPMFRLVFPQPEMLPEEHLTRLCDALTREASEAEIADLVRRIRLALNPHPADQTTLNIPRVGQQALPGIQHKYHETVLFFPSQGQTCHAYCTYCFRWAQFVDLPEFKIASSEVSKLVDYLERHPEVSDVLLTGGDPLIMRTKLLRRYLEPLLEVDTLSTIRIGTKALSWWPGRFVEDADADDLLGLFGEVLGRGKHLALMAHITHPRELSTPRARRAIARVQSTGAVIRAQAPLVRHINDDADVWAKMWRAQVKLGVIPYYMFIPRDTGARRYFEVGLVRAHQIYRDAIAQVSGLARTARGPSMSTSPGKIVIDGPAQIAGTRVLAMRFLQARKPAHVNRPFFAEYDEEATWLEDLRPAFGQPRFFFEE
ncbi:MAG: lysine 2,3-aminomutase [Myxococcota bacterium]|nr:lysine 2,3-aminomutase [Myxococcota bacterium]